MKLICSDFDKTIYFPDDIEQTKRNLSAIQEWRRQGNAFSVATNRSFASVQRQLPDFRNYFDYLILDSGSEVFSIDGKLIWSTSFDEGTLHKLFDAAKKLPEEPAMTFFNATAADFSFAPLEKMTKIRFWFKEYNNALKSLDTIVKINKKTFLTKFDSLSDNKSVLGGYIAFLDIIPETAGKNNAIRKLAKALSIADEDIFTIGDGENDADMIRDFNGFAIEGSSVTKGCPYFNTVKSLENLINQKIGE